MEDILVDIFKYTRCPASFMRVNKSWLNTAKNPVSRCHWLINHYGKAHSLFFAVYFGPSFISIDLVNCALRNGVILSRYFLQVLMKCYVRYDGSNHSNFEKSWGSDLPLDVYEKLLAEGNRRWNGGFCLNGNDLELFHYLNRGNAENVLNDIREASFARANKSWLKTAKDPESRCYWLINRYGKAHSLFFAVYFGPSFISVDLVNCALKNDVILSQYFLQVLKKCCGGYDERLIELRSDYSDFEKLWGSDLPLDVYEKLLAEGNRRWNENFCLNEECLFEIIGGGGNLEQTTCVLDFLFQQIEGSPENIFLKILKHYGIGETSVRNVNSNDENLEDLKLFSFDLCVYPWILKSFKPYPIIISKCFVEILLTKSYFDSNSSILTRFS
ncbi:7775_t:CDS:2 [Entrophospora sp. SA101]|nr:7775_t:CDS:2 [Entrophospora sp. SA101]